MNRESAIAEKIVKAAYMPTGEFKSLVGWKNISGRAANKVAVELEFVLSDLESVIEPEDMGSVRQNLGRLAGSAETAAKEFTNLSALAAQMAARMGR